MSRRYYTKYHLDTGEWRVYDSFSPHDPVDSFGEYYEAEGKCYELNEEDEWNK